jgi:hypothetical protein
MEKIHTRNPISSPQFNKESDDKNTSSFSNILNGSFKRASEAIRFFEKKGSSSKKVINRAFFMYLSVKKDAQRTIVEKIARSLGFEMPFSEYLADTEKKYKDTGSVEQELEDIFAFIHEIAADELEFYLNYAAVEKDARIHSLLLMLADLSKEFLFDVKIWYLNHKAANRILNIRLNETNLPDYMVEEVWN